MTRLERLLVATKNAGKVAEFRAILGDAQLALDDLCDGRDAPDVEEVGYSFIENASLKAAAYATHFGAWALADDSGLCVDALAGRPGIHSARWAAMHARGAGDADNNRLLLEKLADVPDGRRDGRFRCALALADERGRIVLTAQGDMAGRLLREPRGANGFGYDPLFFLDASGKTTAELSPAEKHAVSHRGHAMRRMVELMRATGLLPNPHSP